MIRVKGASFSVFCINVLISFPCVAIVKQARLLVFVTAGEGGGAAASVSVRRRVGRAGR